MSKKLILLIVSFIIILGLSSGIYFIAKSKISSDNIHKIVLNQIRQVFPKAEVSLGDIKVKMGTTIYFNVDKLGIYLPKDKKKFQLIDIPFVQAEIPIWSIITGGGAINFRMKKPSISYYAMEQSSNWLKAMIPEKKRSIHHEKKNKPTPKVKDETPLSFKDIVVPAFIANSTINLKLESVSFFYQLLDQSSGSITLSKIILKNMSLTQMTAFEIDSLIKVKLGNIDSLSTKALVVGEIDLTDLLNKESLKSVVNINIKDTETTFYNKKLPAVKIHIGLLASLKGDIDLNSQIRFFNESSIKAILNIRDGIINVNQIKGELVLNEFKNILPEMPLSLDFRKSQFDINGDIHIDKKGFIKENLSLKLSSPIGVRLDNIESDVLFDFLSREGKQKTTFRADLFKGNLTSNIKSAINVNAKGFTFDLLPTIYIDMAVNNLKFSKKFIGEYLYPTIKKAESKKPTSESVANDEKVQKQSPKVIIPLFPKADVSINFHQIEFDRYKFDGVVKSSIRNRRGRLESFKFSYGTGSGIISSSLAIDHNSKMNMKYSAKLNNLDFETLYPFLPQELGNAKGHMNSELSGTASYSDKLTYSVKFNFNATDGNIEQLNIGEYLKEYAKKISMLKGKVKNQTLDFKDGFEIVEANGTLSEKEYLLNNFKFIGIKKKIELIGKGSLFPKEDQKGSIYLDYKDHTGIISKPLKKEFGLTTLPLLLTGTGFILLPDYDYTLKILMKKAANVQGKKVLKKVTNKILKNKKVKAKVNKILKNKKIEKKAKKFFKKLFK